MDAPHPTPPRMNTAPQIERRDMAFVLRLKICGIEAPGIYQIKEGPPVARRPFESTETAALFRAAGRIAAAASAARGARGRRCDRAEGGHENEQQREQGLLHDFSPRSVGSGVFRKFGTDFRAVV